MRAFRVETSSHFFKKIIDSVLACKYIQELGQVSGMQKTSVLRRSQEASRSSGQISVFHICAPVSIIPYLIEMKLSTKICLRLYYDHV